MHTKFAIPVIALAAFSISASGARAAAILSPADSILGGQRQGGEFVIGSQGTAGNTNNWPAAEPPEDVINGLIGGSGEKYLNFAKLDTGVLVTPVIGSSVARSIEFWVANDAEPRDPASFEIHGTNVTISGGGPFNMSDFVLIADGPLNLPSTRDTVTDTSGFSQRVGFSHEVPYTSYLVLFPTLKDAPVTNSMQISEIQIYDVIPEPSAAALAGFAALGACLLRRRRM